MHIQNAYRERMDYLISLKRSLAAKLKAERLRRGWSRRQMAVHLGTDHSIVVRVENGVRMPTLDKLLIMLFAVGLEASVITREENNGEDKA